MNNKNYPAQSLGRSQLGNPAGRKVNSKNVSRIVRGLLEHDISEKLLVSDNILNLTDGNTN